MSVLSYWVKMSSCLRWGVFQSKASWFKSSIFRQWIMFIYIGYSVHFPCGMNLNFGCQFLNVNRHFRSWSKSLEISKMVLEAKWSVRWLRYFIILILKIMKKVHNLFEAFCVSRSHKNTSVNDKKQYLCSYSESVEPCSVI